MPEFTLIFVKRNGEYECYPVATSLAPPATVIQVAVWSMTVHEMHKLRCIAIMKDEKEWGRKLVVDAEEKLDRQCDYFAFLIPTHMKISPKDGLHLVMDEDYKFVIPMCLTLAKGIAGNLPIFPADVSEEVSVSVNIHDQGELYSFMELSLPPNACVGEVVFTALNRPDLANDIPCFSVSSSCHNPIGIRHPVMPGERYVVVLYKNGGKKEEELLRFNIVNLDVYNAANLYERTISALALQRKLSKTYLIDVFASQHKLNFDTFRSVKGRRFVFRANEFNVKDTDAVYRGMVLLGLEDIILSSFCGPENLRVKEFLQLFAKVNNLAPNRLVKGSVVQVQCSQTMHAKLVTLKEDDLVTANSLHFAMPADVAEHLGQIPLSLLLQ